MTPEERTLLAQVGRQFEIPGRFHDGHRIKVGHINETFAAVYDRDGDVFRVVHQTINTHVFKDPVALMNNVVRVTEHVRARLKQMGCGDVHRRTLQVIPARDGQSYHVDADGRFWRSFVYVADAQTYEAVETPAQARQAGFAFGQFQNLLSDLPADRLATTIPDFHHTPKRYERLLAAIHGDSCNRAKLAAREIRFALSQEPLVAALIQAHARGELPERVTHNDTKFNNVMLDLHTGEAMCVVDLDTVMPGLVHYDFGDMVRTATSRTAEDEMYLERVELEMPMFEALARGYLEATRGFLTSEEKALLVLAGKLVTFTIGIRFLTDYLEGDGYFRIHREHHNLDRCRKQFKLIQSIIEHEEAMHQLIGRLS